MFSHFPLPTPRQLDLLDVDEATLRFLESLPGVYVRPHFLGYQVVIPQGVIAMQVASDPNGDETWLYCFSPDQVLGHDIESTMPESVWKASELHWAASTPFEFAQVCYNTNLAEGHLSPDAPPPDPADYAE